MSATKPVDEEKSDVQLAVRVPKTLVERVDRYTGSLNAATPGLLLSRSAGVRSLLEQALAGWESLQGGKP